MNKIDTEHIKIMTNQIIGFENYKKEKIMKKNNMLKVVYVFLGAITLCVGTLTVDAMTNNAISDTVKEMFSVKANIDGKENNASCIKNTDGSFTCTVEGEEDNFNIKTDK